MSGIKKTKLVLNDSIRKELESLKNVRYTEEQQQFIDDVLIEYYINGAKKLKDLSIFFESKNIYISDSQLSKRVSELKKDVLSKL